MKNPTVLVMATPMTIREEKLKSSWTDQKLRQDYSVAVSGAYEFR